MSRISAPNAAVATQTHVPFALFVHFDFSTGHVRLTSWDSDFAFGGNTYQSLGKFGGVASISETADLVPQPLTFTLSGVDSSIIATTLTEKYHGRSAELYVGWLDAKTGKLADTPYLLWEGAMDTMTISSDVGQSNISLVCENRLILWSKVAGWRYTDDDQRQFAPDDNFFNLVQSLANKTAQWGLHAVTQGPTPPRPDVDPRSFGPGGFR